ncbi:MAG: hypothetical protein KF683_25000, partial [Rubrivivax sp.]|nr:hypothetical protein [Rubrivivax sp.]
MPTIADSPLVAVHLVESLDPLGPFGAKEASEGGLHATPPAIAAAVCDALGLRLRQLPLTPERVLEALQQQRREQRLARSRETRETREAREALQAHETQAARG